MSRKEIICTSPPTKKLRFRGELNLDGNRIEDIFDHDVDNINRKKNLRNNNEDLYLDEQYQKELNKKRSLFDFVKLELTRGYLLEHDEERYSARRQKIYTFMKIPREFEKFMAYGVLQCADSFIYIHTFLPIRYVMALWAIIWRPIATCFGLRRRGQRILTPAEICDLLKGTIWIICALCMLSIDTNRIYHVVKTQSVIKLYIFYNMLEVGDRLLSAFGQDTIDALFWTATEPKEKNSVHLSVLSHSIFTFIYLILHSCLIMFQATTLNVAINSNNKGLLAIMMSNNFVELKGSVFKKFDKNNLFQLSCSDVRERVHLAVLLFVVVIQTMKEFNWRLDHLLELLPDCLYVFGIEILVDWVKHAFITRFNELSSDVYKEYTISLAYDMTQTRQKHAFSDHSDLVARRMGFIPFPLGVILIKAVYSAISFTNPASIILFIIVFFILITCRILNTICTLGKACDLLKKHHNEKNVNSAGSSSSGGGAGSHQNLSPTNNSTNYNNNSNNSNNNSNGIIIGKGNISEDFITSTILKQRNTYGSSTSDVATSPLHSSSFLPLQRSKTVDIVPTSSDINKINSNTNILNDNYNNSNNINNSSGINNSCNDNNDKLTNKHLVTNSNFGPTALFSNSDVDLDDICLNEKLLNHSNDDVFEELQQTLTRSVPDLQQEPEIIMDIGSNSENSSVRIRRTHKRSESEPFIQSAANLESE